jgi:hypothetical protein
MNRLSCFALLAILGASSFAAPVIPLRAQLEANYALFASAWHAKNLGPTYSLMTDDFTAVGMDTSGKAIDRKQMIARTKQLLAADHITWPRHILSVSMHDKMSVAMVDGHFTGMMRGQNGTKPSKLEILAKTKDTWVLVGKTWKFKRMEIVSSTMKVDGKPMKR